MCRRACRRLSGCLNVNKRPSCDYAFDSGEHSWTDVRLAAAPLSRFGAPMVGEPSNPWILTTSDQASVTMESELRPRVVERILSSFRSLVDQQCS